jgi:hypothetical protein
LSHKHLDADETDLRSCRKIAAIHGQAYVQDENLELIPYVPPSPPARRQFAQKDRARASETRDRRHGRHWYAKRLLAIAEGNETPTKKQLTALLTLGRLNGWHRRSR